MDLCERAASTITKARLALPPVDRTRLMASLCRLYNRIFICVAVLLFSILLPFNSLSALEKDDTLLILDASGSMWGRVDGRSKIETARDVIVDLLAASPTRHKLGLMSYGHRRKGDCGDIELLVRPARSTREAIQGAVMSIKPRGKTPLSASVIQAARVLRSDRNKATVILVSDGRETCGYDPCQVARELEASGIDFTAHVIGFNVTDPIDLSQLQCMAKNTGGQFVAAANGNELSHALQSVSTVFAQTADAGTALRNTPGGTASSTNSSAQKSAAANDAPNVTEVGNIVLDGDVELDIDALSLRTSRAQHGSVTPDSQDAKSVNGKSTSVENPSNSGGSGRRESDFGRIERDRTERSSADSNEDSAGLGAGTSSASEEPSAITEVPASSINAAIPASLTVPPVLYTLQIFTARWTGPGLAEDLITIALPESAAGEWLQAVPVGGAGKLKLTAPEQPGEYEVRYVAANMNILATAAITVRKAQATLIAPQQARSGRLVRIRWKDGTRDPKDAIVISRKGAPLSSSINRRFIRGQSSVMLLMPSRSGDYELRYIQAGGNVIASQSIVIK